MQICSFIKDIFNTIGSVIFQKTMLYYVYTPIESRYFFSVESHYAFPTYQPIKAQSVFYSNEVDICVMIWCFETVKNSG